MNKTIKQFYDGDTYKIWYWRYEDSLKKWITGRYTKEYKTEGRAIRVARKVYDHAGYSWMVSKDNPFRKICPNCGKEYYLDKSPLGGGNRVKMEFINSDGRVIKNHIHRQLCDDCFELMLDLSDQVLLEGEQQ